jgi:hypothetical protein
MFPMYVVMASAPCAKRDGINLLFGCVEQSMAKLLFGHSGYLEYPAVAIFHVL